MSDTLTTTLRETARQNVIDSVTERAAFEHALNYHKRAASTQLQNLIADALDTGHIAQRAGRYSHLP